MNHGHCPLLFSFTCHVCLLGVGSSGSERQVYTHLASGVARTEANKKIANIIESDLQLVVRVESGPKKLVSIADLVCDVCRSSGATSVNLVEHDMLPKVQDGPKARLRSRFFGS